MRQIPALLVAAILGSVLTLGTFHFLGLGQQVIIQEKTDNAPSKLANFEAGQTGVIQQQQKNNNNGNSFLNVLKNRPSSGSTPIDFTDAAAETMPAVVHISSIKEARTASRGRQQKGYGWDLFRDFFGEDFDPYGNPGGNRPREATGSGVIVSNNGYIMTNNHVIEDADKLEVTLFDERNYEAEIIGTDPSTDLALIKIKENSLPHLRIADSDHTKVGEWVLAVGNPFNLASTVTAGIISAKGRNINILHDKYAIESFIQTDAAVNPGNSGGALVNTNGELIGINTAIASPNGAYAGYSFAVPSNIVKKVMEDLKTHGVVQRAYLGVMIRSLDGKFAEELGLNITQGVYVDSLIPTGAAKAAGIRKGDIIVEIDGASVKSSPELQEVIGRTRPGDQVSVKVNRKGQMKNIMVTLNNSSGNTGLVKKEASKGFSTNIATLGAELEELSSKEAKSMGLYGGVRVKKLKDGPLKKSTDIQEGFIITKINDREVSSIDEIQSLLNNRRGGGILLEGRYPDSPTSYYYGFGL